MPKPQITLMQLTPAGCFDYTYSLEKLSPQCSFMHDGEVDESKIDGAIEKLPAPWTGQGCRTQQLWEDPRVQCEQQRMHRVGRSKHGHRKPPRKIAPAKLAAKFRVEKVGRAKEVRQIKKRGRA